MRSKSTALILAVLLGCCTWFYTIEKDWLKLVIAGVILVFLGWLIIPAIGVWLWAVIDVAIKDAKWYEGYK